MPTALTSIEWPVLRRDGNSATLTIPVTPFLKSALETEAWESQLTLAEYVRTLLGSRGKYARTVGLPGNYLIGVLQKQKKAGR
jgi:hypothetical protein